MLAAYDIAARLPTLTVRCYTYGAPRTGNRAFAEDYGRVVEDTWHIINGEPLPCVEPHHCHGHRMPARCRSSCVHTMVPDCADQDVVARGAKFGVYKR